MRRHWQKKPLLVRGATAGTLDWLDRPRLAALAAVEGVESRLVARQGGDWRLRHGPFRRGALPPASRPGWTLLVQGVEAHWPEARRLLDGFRFVPDARLDDLMVSYASDGGGVGPHRDSYDVFLLQARGHRRWRIGRARAATPVPGVPLKLLANFEPEEEWLLGPGDMLYLPPGWGHDGVAEGGDCITCSIGFRAPARDALGREILRRWLDALEDEAADVAEPAVDDAATDAVGAARPAPVDPLYRDPDQGAVDDPGRIPLGLQTFAADAVCRLLADPEALRCALGEVLSEPKAGVRFAGDDADETSAAVEGDGNGGRIDGASAPVVGRTRAAMAGGIALAPPTRMLYDDRRVYVNGEAFRAGGRDARVMRRLADRRCLAPSELAALSADAAELLEDWRRAGWVVRIEGAA